MRFIKSLLYRSLRASDPGSTEDGRCDLKEAGYIKEEIKNLNGRSLGLAVANGMIAFARDLNFPTTLKEAGATREHLDRMLTAAKNPQLKMKLQNMPTPMDAEKGDVDRLMKPVLEAAFTGDLSLIP